MGASGTRQCCFEHVLQIPSDEVPPGGSSTNREGRMRMDIVVERCAGLDVHKDTVVACVRVPGPGRRRSRTIATFGTTTVESAGAAGLAGRHRVTLVGMESTGVYWKPVFYVLENEIECWLFNARHLRNVPGRKTDVSDAAWIAGLVEHGLVRPSFVPPRTDPRVAQPDPLPTRPDRRTHPRSATVGQGAAGRRDQAVLGGHATSWGCRGGRCLTRWSPVVHDPEALADLAEGRLRQKLPRSRAGIAGPVRVASRLAGRSHPRQVGLPRRDHRVAERGDRRGDPPFRAHRSGCW